jgi:tRNA G18 (ribose-2'-O)-methylase SpoU
MSYQSANLFIDQASKPNRPPFVVIETAVGAQSLYDFRLPPDTDEYHVVIGGEVKGVHLDIMACLVEGYDHTVYIPMHGRLKSMNVTHALAVALNELCKQRHCKEER